MAETQHDCRNYCRYAQLCERFSKNAGNYENPEDCPSYWKIEDLIQDTAYDD